MFDHFCLSQKSFPFLALPAPVWTYTSERKDPCLMTSQSIYVYENSCMVTDTDQSELAQAQIHMPGHLIDRFLLR